MVNSEEIKLWEKLTEALEALGSSDMKNIAQALMKSGYVIWSGRATNIANAMEKIERHQKDNK